MIAAEVSVVRKPQALEVRRLVGLMKNKMIQDNKEAHSQHLYPKYDAELSLHCKERVGCAHLRTVGPEPEPVF